MAISALFDENRYFFIEIVKFNFENCIFSPKIGESRFKMAIFIVFWQKSVRVHRKRSISYRKGPFFNRKSAQFSSKWQFIAFFIEKSDSAGDEIFY